MHIQENFSFSDFVDKNVADIEPLKPSPLESTPFKLVEEVKDLKELAAKLRVADEFSVICDFTSSMFVSCVLIGPTAKIHLFELASHL